MTTTFIKLEMSMLSQPLDGRVVICKYLPGTRGQRLLSNPSAMFSPDDYDHLASTTGKVYLTTDNKQLLDTLQATFPTTNILSFSEQLHQEMLRFSQPIVVVDDDDDRLTAPPSCIEDGLYLGDARNASCHKTISRLGISVIINCTQDIPFEKMDGVEFHRVPVCDTLSSNIAEFFYKTNAIIEKARADGKNVLVHCFAGISRSPTIVAAYLMHKHYINTMTAVARIKAIRPCVEPNIAFFIQLAEFETILATSS